MKDGLGHMSGLGGWKDGRRRWSRSPVTILRHSLEEPPPDRVSPDRIADVLSFVKPSPVLAPEPPVSDEDSPGESPPDPTREADALAAASEESVPAAFATEATTPEELLPAEAVPDEASPADAVSEDVLPEAAPEELLPAEAAPEELLRGVSAEAEGLVRVPDEADSAALASQVSAPVASAPRGSGRGRHRSQEPRKLLPPLKFWG